ncbi:MAG: hypothetical protein ACK5MI_00300 [Mangrovibacterium sp.]
MKQIFRKGIVALVLSISLNVVSAQHNYTQVYIPTSFPTIGSGVNPYQISTSLQQVFISKDIKTTFNKNSNSDSYCDELQVGIIKENSMLRCKVKVQLTDCRGEIVWEEEGAGRSKNFVDGYAEAVADALKDLDNLPSVAIDEVNASETKAPVSKNKGTIYYNDKYLLELNKKVDRLDLIVLNSDKLDYQKKQIIATLKTADLEDLYEVKFTMPNGTIWLGVAMMKGEELSLSIANGENKQKIVLHKQ